MLKFSFKLLINILFIGFFGINGILFVNIRNFSVINDLLHLNFNLFYILISALLVIGIVLIFIFYNLNHRFSLLKKLNFEQASEIVKIDEKEIENRDRSSEIKKKVTKLLPTEKITSLDKYSEILLSQIAKVYDIVLGIMYVKKAKTDEFGPVATYAYYSNDPPVGFKNGETLAGQVAKNQRILNLNNLPEDYLSAASGLGKALPRHLMIVPILTNDQTIGIIELAKFSSFNKDDEKIFEEFAKEINNKINTFIK